MFKAIGTGKKTKVRVPITCALKHGQGANGDMLIFDLLEQKKSWKRMITKPTFGE